METTAGGIADRWQMRRRTIHGRETAMISATWACSPRFLDYEVRPAIRVHQRIFER
jgi:hypothetical protein